MALTITDANFQELLESGKPLVVDFWAEWCGPCRMITPIIEDLAKEYDGRANIGKCNVDENDAITQQFGIRNIPTILFFKNGELVDKVVGASQKPAIAAKIEAIL
ncbi:MAG: thioredoxin [Bacteroidales bacterium]